MDFLRSLFKTQATPQAPSAQSTTPAVEPRTCAAGDDYEFVITEDSPEKIEWDKQRELYATARDSDGNLIEIRKINKNNRGIHYLYWDSTLNVPVDVYENKTNNTFATKNEDKDKIRMFFKETKPSQPKSLSIKP